MADFHAQEAKQHAQTQTAVQDAVRDTVGQLVRTLTCIHTRMHARACSYTYTCACTRVCACMHARTRHVCTFVRACVHTLTARARVHIDSRVRLYTRRLCSAGWAPSSDHACSKCPTEDTPNTKVPLGVGTVLVFSSAYYRLLARPLFEQRHTESYLLRQVRGLAIVVWLRAMLQRVKEKAIPCVLRLYQKGTLYRDSFKILLNFVQIIGSFERHTCTYTRTHAHACKVAPCTCHACACVQMHTQDRIKLSERVQDPNEDIFNRRALC